MSQYIVHTNVFVPTYSCICTFHIFLDIFPWRIFICSRQGKSGKATGSKKGSAKQIWVILERACRELQKMYMILKLILEIVLHILVRDVLFEFRKELLMNQSTTWTWTNPFTIVRRKRLSHSTEGCSIWFNFGACLRRVMVTCGVRFVHSRRTLPV